MAMLAEEQQPSELEVDDWRAGDRSGKSDVIRNDRIGFAILEF